MLRFCSGGSAAEVCERQRYILNPLSIELKVSQSLKSGYGNFPE